MIDFSSPPPPGTIDWIERHTGSTVTDITQLHGATTAGVHRIDLTSGQPLVLKRFTWADFVAGHPDCAEHEAMALDRIRGHVPAPRVVAYDRDGTETGVPAVLMTFVAGSVAVDLAPESLAEVAAGINAVEPLGVEWRYQPYFTGDELFVPAWSREPDAWARLIDIASSMAIDGEHFVHRDFHPWNVLANEGAVTGVIDWLSAAVGPWEIDVAHCRGNLVLLDRLDAAERYRAEYERLTGRSYSPEWDAMMLVDAMPFYADREAVDGWQGHDVIQPFIGTISQRDLFDAFAARTAAALG